MPLRTIQAFVNTFEADTDIDLLDDPESARQWFASAGLLHTDHRLTVEDLTVARVARESIRALLVANARATTPNPDDLEPLTTIAATSRPLLRIDTTGVVHLDPTPGGGLPGALLALLLIIRDAQLDGTWQRLKACDNDECRWAFYDRSHSRRGMWCDMAVCGNRMKNRNLRTRQRNQPTTLR